MISLLLSLKNTKFSVLTKIQPSLKLKVRTWKWMSWNTIVVSFLGRLGPFSGSFWLVSGSVTSMNHQGFTSNWKLWLHVRLSTFWGWMDHPSIQSKHRKTKGFQVHKLFHRCTIYAYICISNNIYIYIYNNWFHIQYIQNQLFPPSSWKNKNTVQTSRHFASPFSAPDLAFERCIIVWDILGQQGHCALAMSPSTRDIPPTWRMCSLVDLKAIK